MVILPAKRAAVLRILYKREDFEQIFEDHGDLTNVEIPEEFYRFCS